ncbi:MAG: 2-amino-4-hydroxy-6-hydroxymethyldihydropteridine diphosphokinase [Coriobacteriia bacterium]|nr:2-amino-4-hydroxy-6-hydroxymethyldihydropteridine diphosphokinase [Coriobacteriia bacterium]
MQVFLGLGSNMGDRLASMTSALRAIDTLPSTALSGVSHVYESEAWPLPEDPPYANAVAAIETRLMLPDLLALLKEIEHDLGRDMLASRNAPRPIDIDILLAEDDEWDRPDLVVPHPRMPERDFVITPLLELAPDARYPDLSPVTRDTIRVGRITRVLGPVPGFADRTPSGDIAERPAVPPTPHRVRMPMPGEDWVEVYRESRGAGPVFGAGQYSPQDLSSALDASFMEVLLEQDGVPFAWDPFPPSSSTTGPYHLPRPFRLLVPASMAPQARELLEKAASAPFDWSEAMELADEADKDLAAAGCASDIKDPTADASDSPDDASEPADDTDDPRSFFGR